VSKCDGSVFTQSAATLTALLSGHGLYMGDVSGQTTHHLLLAHLLTGMCTIGRAPTCLTLGGFEMATVQEGIAEIVTECYHEGRIRIIAIRDLCEALGYRVVRSMPSEDMVCFFRPVSCRSALRLDIREFFCSLVTLTRVDLISACASHGLYPSDTNEAMRRLLPHHLINRKCVSGPAGRCRLWQANFFKSFDNADDRVPLLSLILCTRIVASGRQTFSNCLITQTIVSRSCL
jgi:hypothetical protein